VLGKQALRILAIGAETRRLQSGAVLYYAGDLADGGYLVQQGSLLLEPGVPSDGKEIIVGPGTLVGELALISDMVCPMTATAQEPTVVIRVSRSQFRKMLEGYPAAAVKLRDVMATRIDAWTRELVQVKQTMDNAGDH
jgi:CRP-like cAMP-binding protein